MYRWFVAYKHIASRLITFAALLGVTLSVAVLIVVVSVMEGFRSELEKRIRGTISDIKVESTLFTGIKDPESVASGLRRVPGVQSVAPVIETLALYRSEKFGTLLETEDRNVIAVDLSNPVSMAELDEYLQAVDGPELSDVPRDVIGFLRGIFSRLPRSSAEIFSREWVEKGLWKALGWPEEIIPFKPGEFPTPILAGAQSFRQERLLPGDVVQLTSFSPTTLQPRNRKFLVAGYFKTGLYELDSKGLILAMDDAVDFLELRDPGGMPRATGFRVTADGAHGDGEALKRLRGRIEQHLEDEGILFVRAQTWREARQPLLRAVQVEKFIVSIILGVVILFAGFMIFIILTVQVVERSRDIGVLQSLGATRRGIAAIYFTIGLSLCLAGMLLGSIYGLGFALSVNTIQRWISLLTGYEVFPADVYYLDHIPVRFRTADLVFIIVPTVASSLIASVIPAWRAARRDPARALRYE
jgi:lipoprotein-releasing system permease protein